MGQTGVFCFFFLKKASLNSLALLTVCVRGQSWIVSITDFNILPIDQLFCLYGIRDSAAVSGVAYF